MPPLSENEVFNHGDGPGNQVKRKRKREQTTDASTEEYDVELAFETMKMEPIVPKTENEKTYDEMRATFLTRCRKLKLATTLNLPGCT